MTEKRKMNMEHQHINMGVSVSEHGGKVTPEIEKEITDAINAVCERHGLMAFTISQICPDDPPGLERPEYFTEEVKNEEC